MNVRKEALKRMTDHLTDDPAVQALDDELEVMGSITVTGIEDTQVRLVTRLSVGEMDAILFLADQVQELRAAAGLR